ncbi:NAD(P)/FAD-dependent oxidoreductase [Williamsia sp. CHRR-6]|uniref:NAD(P)/FAD-dependent oxidoreductase n=1 Tax=Williamsia sp. CHRR-6 TaxID=2835871 RepID=UPI001BDA6073|nr:FAD-dependent oxidoreductase [Williamsia sp. CHRR-6]MBT0567175.1 FAD-dependent oxidoreductase [Williamsia sp. CHRR-6]
MNSIGVQQVLIIGASASGTTTAEALRRKGFTGQITLLGDETHAPYDRPPLSKQFLAGEWDLDKIALRSPDRLAELDLDIREGDPAVSLDAANRTVTTRSGAQLSADAIVIATGVTARDLGWSDVYSVRTVDDSRRLRSAVTQGSRAVVVGCGVLGSEIGATLHKLGADVSIVGPEPVLMAGPLGATVGNELSEMHRAHGVDLRCGVGVVNVDGGHTVTLADDSDLNADVVVSAVGSTPATDWLAGSGLEVDNGVVCDSQCRAADGVYAVGDVARWFHPGRGALMRLENRTNATEQAQVVAANILGDEVEYAPIPYFWTTQFDATIQVHGTVTPTGDTKIVDGDTASGRFVAEHHDDGALHAVIGWNMAKQARQRRANLSVATNARA